MDRFRLVSKFKLTGDQPQAVRKLVKGLKKDCKAQTLLGITGSGKTFTVANVIAQYNRPTLVISHNKTLAAQLYSEFKSFFPDNAVEYFVSYYDYYLPESYIPSTDTYIEKETEVNDDLNKLRFAATGSLMSRRDVIIVASVSCIFGLGMALKDYRAMHLIIDLKDEITREDLMARLVDMQYKRIRNQLEKGDFRVNGDIIDVYPPGEDHYLRIELEDDIVDHLSVIHPVSGNVVNTKDSIYIYPAKHFAAPPEKVDAFLKAIEAELEDKLAYWNKLGKPVEAYRLETRTRNDIEMIKEIGYCSGIENYSRHLTERKKGQPPYTLMDYFPPDYLLIVDESHVTLPQVRGMHKGDRSRKRSLVEHGFRLDSAYDNRPLMFPEFEERINKVIFTSATPGRYELEKSGQIVEQIQRPTGLLDPNIDVRPTKDQIDDLLAEIRATVERKNRVLVTTLTKKMAEELTEYLSDKGVRARYLHSEIDTLDRIEVLRDLRDGAFDVLVGINLLREGLDMPVVELVSILDADKEGFLRSAPSLIQVIGRASRNKLGRVIMYADKVTRSMELAISVTLKRRKLQTSYNKRHSITPKTISSTGELMKKGKKAPLITDRFSKVEAKELIRELEVGMKKAARNHEFELAAKYRDEITALTAFLGKK